MAHRYHSTPTHLLIFVLLITLMLLAAPIPAWAGWKGAGAGGCGNFVDAVNQAAPGDILLQMFDNNEGRNSGEALIKTNLIIEGGWSPPAGGCSEPNETLETPQAVVARGFTFGAPQNRALLFSVGDLSVVRIDPAVKQLQVLHTIFERRGDTGAGVNGGGLSAPTLSGAQIKLYNSGFRSDPNQGSNPSQVSGAGGGLYLDIDNGSRVSISRADFTNLSAGSGGGFEIHVRGGSHLLIEDSQVLSNTARIGNGGGGRIIVHSGYVTVTNTLFRGNKLLSAGARGAGLAIERPSGSSGPAFVWLKDNNFAGGSADLFVTQGNGLEVYELTPRAYLPLALRPGEPPATVRITSITRSSSTPFNYIVNYTTSNYTPQLPGTHIHFFFDTVPPTQAGVPNGGPWFVYAGPVPFTGYSLADRPAGATRLCALVANSDHSVRQGTGNCVELP